MLWLQEHQNQLEGSHGVFSNAETLLAGAVAQHPGLDLLVPGVHSQLALVCDFKCIEGEAYYRFSRRKVPACWPTACPAADALCTSGAAKIGRFGLRMNTYGLPAAGRFGLRMNTFGLPTADHFAAWPVVAACAGPGLAGMQMSPSR
jgi:hypothetical protein